MDILEIKREFLEMKEKTENIRRSLWLRKEKVNYKGVREFSLIDLEILNNDLGKPYVVVSEKLDKILKNKKEDYQIEISISHSRKYATTMAIIF